MSDHAVKIGPKIVWGMGCEMARERKKRSREKGWTLLELLITITILTILSLGVIPLVKMSVRRQREERLREALREIRAAIDEFHRDAIGICTPVGPQQLYVDPRSRVMISDCTIFTPDNPDRYPPDLETLVRGVSVVPRAAMLQGGNVGNMNSNRSATEVGQVVAKKKIYLRAIPIDPMTGRADWELRSSYDPPDATSWGGENVFDVHSRSKELALNGKERYSEW